MYVERVPRRARSERFGAVILVDFGRLGVDLSVRRARSERFGAVLAVILGRFRSVGRRSLCTEGAV